MRSGINMTKEELIEFESEIENEFIQGHIKAPIHLSGGNEEPLLHIFQYIKPDSWVFSGHRSHYHALLHGIPKEWLKNEILQGRSMHINSREYKFMTSSIVNGVAPIAVGVALGIKREYYKPVSHGSSVTNLTLDDKMDSPKVWCFVGDMAYSTGEFHNSSKYAECQNLPIYFVIECNDLATNSPTGETWGIKHNHHSGIHYHGWQNGGIYHYCYTRTKAHINVSGVWVDFK